MLKILIVPLTRPYIYDYIDNWYSKVEEELNRAVGTKAVEVYVWPETVMVSMNCFDWQRGQYIAPCVLNQLSTIFSSLAKAGMYIVGIGYLDGYDVGLNFVFGEADPGNRVAVVFTRRLDQAFYGLERDYNLYAERVIKELIHELGHIMGLPHCNKRSCVMSFSNSVAEVDLKTHSFCEKCANALKRVLLGNR